MIYDDENFIKQLKNKQEGALLYAVDRYLPAVKAVITRVLIRYGNTQIIEECINDVFLAVWNNSVHFTGYDATNFKKWIVKIAKFKAIDYYRKQNRNREVCLEEWEDAGTLSPEEELVAMEDRTELVTIINTLDKIDRQIFIMKFFMGESSELIANKMGLTRAAVDNRIYRGKQKLIQKLEVASL